MRSIAARPARRARADFAARLAKSTTTGAAASRGAISTCRPARRSAADRSCSAQAEEGAAAAEAAAGRAAAALSERPGQFSHNGYADYMATGAKGRVLLVEASRGAEARAKRLAKAGFQTRRVADESAALALGAKEAFDVLLVDLELPRIDGLSLIRRLRANGSAAAVVLLAAELTNELAAKAVEAGVFQVLKKPAQANDLERVVAAGVTHTRHVLATLRAVLRPSGAVRSVPATDAKNEFGSLLETAVVDGAVVITKHDAPKAVLLSVDRVNALLAKHEPDLLALTREFDDLVARMRTREARAAARSLFSASPEQLGEAALAGARKGRG